MKQSEFSHLHSLSDTPPPRLACLNQVPAGSGRAAEFARPTAWLVVGLALSGCTESRDEYLIEETRVLAIRTQVVTPGVEIPDPNLAPTKAQALPFEFVQISPFVVEPGGNVEPKRIDPLWIACGLAPGQGLGSCLRAELPVPPAQWLPVCADVQVGIDALLSGEQPPSEFPICRINPPEGHVNFVGAEPEPVWQVPFTLNALFGGSIEITMIAGIPGLGTTAGCARPFLEGAYELPDDCLYAVQRISVGPTSTLAAAAESLGLPTIPGGDLGLEEEIASDANPRITAFSGQWVDEDDTELAPVFAIEHGSTIQGNDGDYLKLTVVSPEEDLQAYPVQTNNGESTELRFESYEGRWFRSWGQLLSGSSDDPISLNRWHLSDDSPYPEPPADGVASLWYVVRDGRQGVNWYQFDVAVQP